MLKACCISCHKELETQGGLILLNAPPEIGPVVSRGQYDKFHVCKLCWPKVRNKVNAFVVHLLWL